LKEEFVADQMFLLIPRLHSHVYMSKWSFTVHSTVWILCLLQYN